MVSALTKDSVAEISAKTVSTIKDITLELPTARNVEDIGEILLKGDRKMYVGITLIILAVIIIILRSS
ncbi:hypothetical protein TetV_479 [Tetraselmis virus 1]|uniref:Uncharacterized protein n=1 Tax=Tetraselmis virus 1 TaxID=2060617 RepID=A0A2P0VNT5_9VIRU|nr:hypothetical protein QJ968_gp575 [Tetraselmis virus 1]AUF82561.1 hypothetical protein TetV_479 [Tetraselmis virus 1]